MVAALKAQQFPMDLAHKVHNLGADSLKVLLSNTVVLNTNATKAALTEITAGNGYTAGGTAPAISGSSQTGGIYKLTLADVVFTATGGPIGPLRYAILYNDTPTSPADPVIQSYDYGSSITLQDGETFTVDFDATNGAIQLS